MKTPENKLISLFMAAFIVMFFSIAVNSQNDVQNGQEQTNKVQRFVDMDINKDGSISKTEFQSDVFDEFDTDQNGVLSRNEYRAINRSTKKNQANGQRNMNSNKGKKQGKGLGTCPNGRKQFAKKKNCKPKQIGKSF